MSWDFKPGVKVVCVDASGVPCLTEGAVYTIRGIHRGSFWRVDLRRVTEDVGLMLVGVSAQAEFLRANRFRPVRETSIESLRAHLNVTPVAGKESARV